MSSGAPKRPCYCPRCKGALVSRRTFENHAKLFPPLPSQPIQGFQDWLDSRPGGSAAGAGDAEMYHGGESGENSVEEEEGIDDENGRLSKRRRVGRVRSHSCSFVDNRSIPKSNTLFHFRKPLKLVTLNLRLTERLVYACEFILQFYFSQHTA